MIVRLDEVEPKTLLLDDLVEIRGKACVNVVAAEHSGESEHLFSQDLVETKWVNFCSGCVVTSIALPTDEGSVCRSTMIASSHVTLRQESAADSFQANQQQGCRFLAVGAASALIEAHDGDTM